MNANIQNTVKPCSTCLEYLEKTTPYNVLAKPWEVVGAFIFMINNENLLCIVQYYSNIPLVKKVEGMLAKDLIGAIKVVFAEMTYLKHCPQMQA